MKKTIRVGIIGCGKIADCHHIPTLKGLDNVELSAFCDILPERMEDKRQRFAPEAALFRDYREMLASGCVDAVVVATPNDLHAPMTIAACEAKLHVLCEKPMAASLEDATAMIRAARRNRVLLQINQSLRYNAEYQTVVDLVREGAIGTPFHVRCIRAGNGSPDQGWSPGAVWFIQQAHNGGLLLDIGIHMADLLRMIMGDAESVTGFVETRRDDIDVPDNVRGLYRFRDGGTGVLELSWTLPGGAGFLEVYGTAGRIRMGFGGEKIELAQMVDGKMEVTHPSPVARATSQAVFRDAILKKAPSLTPGEYGRRALALCLALEKSSSTGRLTRVKHFKDESRIPLG